MDAAPNFAAPDQVRRRNPVEAKDVMTTRVITISPEAKIEDVAELLLSNHISAMPVVDDQKKVVGIISEGDLLHRHETGTERHR